MYLEIDGVEAREEWWGNPIFDRPFAGGWCFRIGYVEDKSSSVENLLEASPKR